MEVRCRRHCCRGPSSTKPDCGLPGLPGPAVPMERRPPRRRLLPKRFPIGRPWLRQCPRRCGSGCASGPAWAARGARVRRGPRQRGSASAAAGSAATGRSPWSPDGRTATAGWSACRSDVDRFAVDHRSRAMGPAGDAELQGEVHRHLGINRDLDLAGRSPPASIRGIDRRVQARGTHFLTYGFPKGFDNGTEASGEVMVQDPGGWLQVPMRRWQGSPGCPRSSAAPG